MDKNTINMNENIDLTKILRGCEGMKLYSTILGEVTLCRIEESNHSYPIGIRSFEESFYSYTKNGKYHNGKGECTLFPSKDQRDWSKFQKPIPINTPMMCQTSSCKAWVLRYYAGCKDGEHRVFTSDGDIKASGWRRCMIPFDKFNPNDIEESLKYNIQK